MKMGRKYFEDLLNMKLNRTQYIFAVVASAILIWWLDPFEGQKNAFWGEYLLWVLLWAVFSKFRCSYLGEKTEFSLVNFIFFMIIPVVPILVFFKLASKQEADRWSERYFKQNVQYLYDYSTSRMMLLEHEEGISCPYGHLVLKQLIGDRVYAFGYGRTFEINVRENFSVNILSMPIDNSQIHGGSNYYIQAIVISDGMLTKDDRYVFFKGINPILKGLGLSGYEAQQLIENRRIVAVEEDMVQFYSEVHGTYLSQDVYLEWLETKKGDGICLFITPYRLDYNSRVALMDKVCPRQ